MIDLFLNVLYFFTENIVTKYKTIVVYVNLAEFFSIHARNLYGSNSLSQAEISKYVTVVFGMMNTQILLSFCSKIKFGPVTLRTKNPNKKTRLYQWQKSNHSSSELGYFGPVNKKMYV